MKSEQSTKLGMYIRQEQLIKLLKTHDCIRIIFVNILKTKSSVYIVILNITRCNIIYLWNYTDATLHIFTEIKDMLLLTILQSKRRQQ